VGWFCQHLSNEVKENIFQYVILPADSIPWPIQYGTVGFDRYHSDVRLFVLHDGIRNWLSNRSYLQRIWYLENLDCDGYKSRLDTLFVYLEKAIQNFQRKRSIHMLVHKLILLNQ
jgi:hypothetical protein